MQISRISGDGLYGLPFVKFTLTFEGCLPSNGDKRDKWAIRKQFHPQLAELWETHRGLIDLKYRRFVHQSGGWMVDNHHSLGYDREPPTAPRDPERAHEYTDVIENIKRGDRNFLPLVRSSLALTCGLKIQFLRKEDPGRLIQQGDLDNRLKTLFDALSMPDPQQVIDDPDAPETICCLLENDALIAGCAIETHRLLDRPTARPREVHLLIEVDVRVTQFRYYNQTFLSE